MKRTRDNYSPEWRGRGSSKYHQEVIRKGQKGGVLYTPAVIMNESVVSQVRVPNQKMIHKPKENIAGSRDKCTREYMHQLSKGERESIRKKGSSRPCKSNLRKVTSEAKLWRRGPSNCLQKADMRKSPAKEAQKGKVTAEGRQDAGVRTKITTENTEEKVGRRVKVPCGKDVETGQSSRSKQRVKDEDEGNQQTKRRRGRPSQTTSKVESSRRQKRYKRRNSSLRETVNEAEQAFNLDSNAHIRNIMNAMEEKVLEEPSIPEMYEWSLQLPDPGHTQGRLSLYHRALHIFWVLKHLLAKAMEQVAAEMVEMAQDTAAAKKEAANTEMLVKQHNELLKDIKPMLMEQRKERVNINID